jgi:uncharacterized protein (DUF427 family)
VKAIWNGQVIAEADRADAVYLEKNWYFPPDSVKQDYLQKSDTPYTCPWRGLCQYWDVGEGNSWSHDNAWSFPDLLPGAVERVHKDFTDYVAFAPDGDVKVEM